MDAVFEQSMASMPGSVTTGFLAHTKRFWQHLHDHVIPHHRNNYHPHLLGHRALALFSLLLVTVKVTAVVALATAPALSAYASAITPENVISLTNSSRAAYKLQALTAHATLAKAAQAKADDMLAKQYFAHNTPDGLKPWDFMKTAGYTYLIAGENLAINFQEAEMIEDAWMNSPGHRANILNKDFEQIGIGIASGQFQGHQTTIVVQMFGTPIAEAIEVLTEPTLVQAAPASETLRVVALPVGVLDSQTLADPAAPVAIAIQSTQFQVTKDQVEITVATSGPVSKVLAQFGNQGVLFDPKSDTLWQATVPLSQLTASNSTVTVQAYDMQGNLAKEQAANFSNGFQNNYNWLDAATSRVVSAFGIRFDPKQVEQNAYLLFIAVILTSLVLAIAIRRHVQHLNLVAHSAFVVVLALLLFVS
jgi:uncharacterized protein YkwD